MSQVKSRRETLIDYRAALMGSTALALTLGAQTGDAFATSGRVLKEHPNTRNSAIVQGAAFVGLLAAASIVIIGVGIIAVGTAIIDMATGTQSTAPAATKENRRGTQTSPGGVRG